MRLFFCLLSYTKRQFQWKVSKHRLNSFDDHLKAQENTHNNYDQAKGREEAQTLYFDRYDHNEISKS